MCGYRSTFLLSWSIRSLTVCGLAIALSPDLALAQSGDMDRARTAYALGQQLFDGGEYETALAAFRESLSAFPHFRTLFNIGLCEEKLGNIENAIDMYNRYVDWPTEVPHRDEVVAKIAELKAMLPTLPPPPPPPPPPTVESSEVSMPREKPDEAMAAREVRKRHQLEVGGIVALSAGAAAMVTGAGFLLAAASRANEIDEINAAPDTYSPTADRELAIEGRKFETAGWVVGGIGLGISAAGGLLLWLARGGRMGDNRASASVVPTAQGVAVVSSWRF
ncbi:MAG: tetratricopeptide repeat protein [Myxococcota bacterium]|nr:tetratricopeptide repeat protein [Myxococcota bacterium]